MQSQELEQFVDISYLTCWYQPIYELKGNNVLGYEALARSNNHITLNPMELFQKADSLGRRAILDRELIIKAQQLFKNLADNTLFINIFPSTLLEEGFLLWWDMHSGIVPSIVLELSETEQINDRKSLKFVLKELKRRGIKIALDDIGAGYSSLQYWVELEPEYLKIDRYYIKDIARHIKKRKVLESIVKLVEGSTEIIIEGVEDAECLDIAKKSGIKHAQGYLMGMPHPITNINDVGFALSL